VTETQALLVQPTFATSSATPQGRSHFAAHQRLAIGCE